MSSFSALKTAIQAAIKQNGNNAITGDILQDILLSIVSTLGDSAINNLETALGTETTNRQNADGTLQQAINSEVLAREGADSTLAGAIQSETEAREGADTTLQGNIGNEATARTNADAALQQNINTEIGLREQADALLDQKITNEKNARIAADEALSGTIQAINNQIMNGYVYAGIARPSSAPTSGKVFYFATQAGRYTNFGNIDVVAGINILKKVGSTWVSEFVFNSDALVREINDFEEQVRTLLEDYKPIIINGDVTNAPDEEDITAQPDGLLKFKDKAYDPLVFSGMGRVYLRKNIRPETDSVDFDGFVEDVPAEDSLSGTPDTIWWDRINEIFVGKKDDAYYKAWTDDDDFVPVSTSLIYMNDGNPYRWNGSEFFVDEDVVPTLKNILTQEMLSDANTIYVIQYDYVLGEDITVPANCVLEFDGGSISGGSGQNMDTITGNNTGIQAGPVKIFDINLELNGTFTTSPYNVKWWGAKGDGVTDDTDVLRLCMTKEDIAFIPKGDYVISSTIDASQIIKSNWIGEDGIRNFSRWNIHSKVNIICKGDNNGEPFLIFPRYVKNITICGEKAQNARPIYANSKGVQCGTPYNFLMDAIFDNVTIQGFGIGLNCQECGGAIFENLYLKGNIIALDFTCEYVEGYPDSGYNTSINFKNCIINESFRYAIVCNETIVPSGVEKAFAAGQYTFTEGYIERNTIDNETDCDILINKSSLFTIKDFNTESTNDFFVKINSEEDFIIENCKNWRVKGIYCGGNIIIKDSYMQSLSIYVKRYLRLENSTIYDIINTEDVEHGATNYLTVDILRSKIINLPGYGDKYFNFFSLPSFSIDADLPVISALQGNTINYPIVMFDAASGQWNGLMLANLENGSVAGPSSNNFIVSKNQRTLGVGDNNHLPSLQGTTKYGTIYYNTETKRLLVWSANNRWENALGYLGANNKGNVENRPTLGQIDSGFPYYVSEGNIKAPIIWDGQKWRFTNGFSFAAMSASSQYRPQAGNEFLKLDSSDIGFLFYDRTLNKPIFASNIDINNGIVWREADGAVAGVARSGTFANKPNASDIYVGFHYFCTDKQTTEGATNGIEIIHKGNGVWADALGRVVS